VANTNAVVIPAKAKPTPPTALAVVAAPLLTVLKT